MTPTAPRHPVTLATNGTVRTDDWYWLRDRDNPEVVAYLAEENAHTDAWFAETGDLREQLYREMMGRTFNRLIRLFGVSGIRDTQCGFKLARGEEGRRIAADLKIEGFAWDVEMIWLARRRGYGIAEVGVVWVNSPDSRVDPIRSSFSMLRDVITMRLRHRGER